MRRRKPHPEEPPLPKEFEEGTRPVTTYPLNGYLCSVCYGLQYETPGGATCEQGHGGAEGVEPPHEDDCPITYEASVDCAPPWECARQAAARGWRPQLSKRLENSPTPEHLPGCGQHVRKECQHDLGCPGDTPGPAEQQRGSQHAQHPPPAPVSTSSARVRFVPIPTTPLVQLEGLSANDEEVRGAIVKVAPTLRSSQREFFDGAGVTQQLRQAGALAVLLAPVVLPEEGGASKERKVARANSPEEAVRAYFAELRGVPEDEMQEAEALALELLEQVR